MEEAIKILSAKTIGISCALLSSLFVCSVSARAQQTEGCPWLNRATASGVLGGEARVVITHPANDRAEQINGAPADATCEFTLSNGTATSVLQIAVHTMQSHAKDFGAYLAACGSSGHPLVGVGNEATACVIQKDPGHMTEQVVARVRERAFLFSWSMPKPQENFGEKDLQLMKDKMQNMAEQIAGNLF